MSNQLLIIGNGFDISHGLNTTYKNFVDNYMSEDLIEEWKTVVKINEIIDEWSNFEVVIGELTTDKWFNKYFETYSTESFNEFKYKDERESLDREIDSLNKIFNNIHEELLNFIIEESRKKVYKIDNLATSIDNNALAITFNYTNTAELYVDEVYHIHGSVEENHIIFGYPLRPEFNGIHEKAVVFSKTRLRETLSFIRSLPINISETERSEYIEIFNFFRNRSYTGRGLYFDYSDKTRELMKENSIQCEFPRESNLNKKMYNNLKEERLQSIPKVVDDYLESYYENSKLFGEFDFSNITNLKILGHSITADCEIYDSLFQQLDKLQAIDLYVYEGESNDSIETKIQSIEIFTDVTINILPY